ncbi:glutamate receptor delta-1 subunit-like [Tropilaelaps mercedesae]|uniref:Glutamate receptor delta-1 subunit-like n=1 Tax=Tropilaelaps mercedesae TaxID=418985 RepID=A0A1V9XC89_9ACAR|nr:glutamate receptor delta-1 subunit-like [Tropilaelaps mercedesae]
MFGSLVDNITASMNFTYDVTTPPDGFYGHKFENGSGMLGFLERQEAEIAVGPFTVDYDIHGDHVMTPSCEYKFITAITGMRKAFETRPTPYTKHLKLRSGTLILRQQALEPITWGLIASCITVLATLVILERRVFANRTTFWSVSADFFAMLQTLLQEGTKDRFIYPFARFNGGLWILGTFILTQLFSSDLKANMVVKTRGHPRSSHDTYSDDIVLEMRKSQMVIIMEDVSGLFRVSLWCATTPYFYYLGFDGFWQLPALMVLGKHLDPDIREGIHSRMYQIAAQKVPFARSKERYPGYFDFVSRQPENNAQEQQKLSREAI